MTIADERIEEIRQQLTALYLEGDNWWDWLHDQPEFDREATAAAEPGQHLLGDGTVLEWSRTSCCWVVA